jgi:hypothetical protein
MIGLLEEETARLRAGVRTQTATPQQLQDTLAAISRTLAQETPDYAAKWSQLAREGANLVDIADAIALESRDASATEVQFWSRALLDAINTAATLSLPRPKSRPGARG